MKLHEKYRFFSLYLVQKSPKIFLYEPKKLCKLQKKQHCLRCIREHFKFSIIKFLIFMTIWSFFLLFLNMLNNQDIAVSDFAWFCATFARNGRILRKYPKFASASWDGPTTKRGWKSWSVKRSMNCGSRRVAKRTLSDC